MNRLISLFILTISFNAYQQNDQWYQVGTDKNLSNQSKVVLEFDNEANLYLAYTDDSAQTLIIEKFDGTSWTQLGASLTTVNGNFGEKDIAIDNNQVPYVIFQDSSSGNDLTVIKYNGTSWDTVGTSNFAHLDYFKANNSPDIEIDPTTNMPVIAHNRGMPNNDISVLYWNGSNWDFLNNGEGLSGYTNSNIDLEIDQNGNYFLGVKEINQSDSIFVYTTNTSGSSWSRLDISEPIIGWSFDFELDSDYLSAIFVDSNNDTYLTRQIGGQNWLTYHEMLGYGNYSYPSTIAFHNDYTYACFPTTNFEATIKRLSNSVYDNTAYSSEQTYLNGPPNVGLSTANACFGQKGDTLYFAQGTSTVRIFKIVAPSIASSEMMVNTQIELYPNPTKHFITIELNQAVQDGSYELYSLDGSKLLSAPITKERTTIPFHDLSTGIYILKINNGNQSFRKRFVINR